jgi:hypothetical protein
MQSCEKIRASAPPNSKRPLWEGQTIGDVDLSGRVIDTPVNLAGTRGQWTPDVHYPNLACAVLRQLADLDGRLTGHQVRFVRLHFDMTLQAFAHRFGVSHVAVLKWEKRGEKPTGMTWSTE